MTDDDPQRTEPAAAPRARRPACAAHAEHVPFLTRTLAPVRGPRRGGPRAHRAQRRHDPRGGRPRVPRRPRRAAPAPRGRRRRPGRARPLPARACAARSSRRPRPAQFTQHARNPARNVEIGGHAHGLRPELRLAVRARPRQRPPLRHDRGLPQLREARLRDARTCTTRGGTVCEPVDVPVNKRHLDMVYAHIRYSDKPFMGSVTAPGAGARHGRDGADRCSARTTSRTTPVILSLINANSPLVWDAVDARRRARLRRGQPGDAHHAVHPGRRDGPGDRGRRRAPRPWPRRSAGWPSSSSSGPARRSSSAPSPARCRCSRARRRSARRSPPSCCTRWPRSPAGSACRSAPAARCAPRRSPTPRRPTSRAATLQPTILAGVNFVLHAAGWLEGGLAIGYEKFILDADQCGMMAVFVDGVDLSENGQALDAILRERPGPALPRQRPHAGQLRDRLLPLRRSPTTTASSSGRRTARSTPPSAPTRSGSGCSPSTRRRRSTPASTRRCSTSSPGARRRCPTPRSRLGRALSTAPQARRRARGRARARPRSADVRADPAQERARPGRPAAARRDGVGDGLAGQGDRGDGRAVRASSRRAASASSRTCRRG